MIASAVHSKQKYDFCIVGAGPAGITLALSLGRSGKTVALIESGGFETSEQNRKKNDGPAKIIKNDNNSYLGSSRSRRFGGTSDVWKGVCRPLDEWDFEKRNWVAQSGWPIHYEEVFPYFNEAAKWVEVKNFEMDESFLPNFFPSLKKSESFRTNLLQLSTPTRFGEKYRKEIVESDKISLFLETDSNRLLVSNGRIESVEVLREGKLQKISAQNFVLCAGAIENAAQLLRSKVGNTNVGAYFMEHLFLPIGVVYAPYSWPTKPIRTLSGTSYAPELTFSLDPVPQKRDQLLQIRFHLEKIKSNSETQFFDAQLEKQKVAPSSFSLFAMVETAPVKSNRVSIKNDRPFLNFDIGTLERRTVAMAPKLLAREFGLASFGRVQHDTKEFEARLKDAPLGYHQMGTTRMAKNASDGVVDTNSKVFGIENLYCVGSSVFPTSGCQNPTLTLLALTLRLANYLKGLK